MTVQLYPKSIPLFVSSDSASGSKNLNSTRNMFQVDLNPPIDIPRAYTPYIKLLKSSIWWSIPNIHGTLYNNNVLVFNNGGADLTLTLDNGLYDVAAINTAISDFMANQGLDNNVVQVNGIESTGKIAFTFNNNTMRIIWTNSTIARVLGWTQGSPQTGPGIAGAVYTSPNVANFNSLETILIHCSIASGTYTSNTGNTDIIFSLSPSVRPGSLIINEPYNPLPCRVNSRHIDKIIFYLSDQNNNTIDTGGEFFSLLLQIDLIPQ